jgi:trehalose 6-phosphate phosphatase
MKRTALLLDIDGTLLDIAETPSRVVVPAGLGAILGRLYERFGGAVAFVSGRTIDVIDALFAPLNIPAIGGHGAEIRVLPHGRRWEWYPAPLSDALRRQLHLLARADPHILMEDKPHSLALHYRRAIHREAFLTKEVEAIVSREPAGDVEVLLGKAVIEVKPAVFSKGSAVRELMEHEPFAGRSPLFIGDDTTDESVFEVLPDLGGCGYSVGGRVSGAHAAFASPRHVRSWLADLLNHSERVE